MPAKTPAPTPTADQNLTVKTVKLHAGQRRIVDESKRFNVLSCGRRFGKTQLLIDRCIRMAIAGHPVAWMAPTYLLLNEPFREMQSRLEPVITAQNVRDHRLELVGGGTLEFFSLDNPSGIRGRKYKLVVVDEAAYVKELLRSWNFVIRPTLADLQGEAWFASTPSGINDFHSLWARGDDSAEDWVSWIMPTDTNPYIQPIEIADMRSSMGDIASRQELDAQFVDMTGAVFRNIRLCATQQQIDEPEESGIYVCGIDLASTTDFTAVKILDISGDGPAREVYSERWTKIVDWEMQLNRIGSILTRFNPVQTVVDRTSHGDKPFQDLTRAMGDMSIRGISFTHATKSALVQSLALAFEKQSIRILNDPATIGELVAYEAKKTTTGLMTYSAPGSGHDDLVSALYLAYHAIGGGSTSMGISPKEMQSERINKIIADRSGMRRKKRAGSSSNLGWGSLNINEW